MKIILQSKDLPEEVWKAFAIKCCGWTEKVMTVDLSPNEEIDNPKPFIDAIIQRHVNPIWDAIAEFNLGQIKEDQELVMQKAQKTIDAARTEAAEVAQEIIQVTIE